MGETDEPYDPQAFAGQPGFEPSQFGPPQYGPPPYPPAGYPPPPGYPPYAGPGYAPPGYAPPGYPPPGYPPPGYPGYSPAHPGYPGYPAYAGYPSTLAGRPGVATAANVLAFIAGGLLVIAGLLLFLGAAAINNVDNLGGPSHHLLSTELALDGLLDLAASGLLIAGGVILNGRRATGRVMLSVGGGIVLGETLYWLVRTGGLATFWALLFAALVIVSLSLAWSRPVTAWLQRT